MHSSGTTVVNRDLHFDLGDVIDLTLGRPHLDAAELVYLGPDGKPLIAQYSLASGGGIAGGHDCGLWGHYDDPETSNWH